MIEYTFDQLVNGLNKAADAGNNDAAKDIARALKEYYPEETASLKAQSQPDEEKGWLDNFNQSEFAKSQKDAQIMPSANEMYDTAKDVVTGESMRTDLSDNTPVVSGGLGQILPGTDSLDDFAGVDASGPATWFGSAFTTDMDELADIYVAKTQGKVRKGRDEKGNVYLVNNETGEIRAMNTPGLDLRDIGQFGTAAAAFTPAGRLVNTGIKGVAAAVGANAGTAALVEGVESKIGGRFSGEEVVAAGLLGGAVPVASNIAKSAASRVDRAISKQFDDTYVSATHPDTGKGLYQHVPPRETSAESLSEFDRTHAITKIQPKSVDVVGGPLSQRGEDIRKAETQASAESLSKNLPAEAQEVARDIQGGLKAQKDEAIALGEDVNKTMADIDKANYEQYIGSRNISKSAKVKFDANREQAKKEFFNKAQESFEDIENNLNLGATDKIQSSQMKAYKDFFRETVGAVKKANSFASIEQSVKNYNQGLDFLFSSEGKLKGLNRSQFEQVKLKKNLNELVEKDILNNGGEELLGKYKASKKMFSENFRAIEKLEGIGLKKDMGDLSSKKISSIINSGDEAMIRTLRRSVSDKGISNIKGIGFQEMAEQTNGNPLKLAKLLDAGMSDKGAKKGWMKEFLSKKDLSDMKILSTELKKLKSGDGAIEPNEIKQRVFRALNRALLESKPVSRAVWSGFGSKKEYIKNKSVNDMILEITAQAARQSNGE